MWSIHHRCKKGFSQTDASSFYYDGYFGLLYDSDCIAYKSVLCVASKAMWNRLLMSVLSRILTHCNVIKAKACWVCHTRQIHGSILPSRVALLEPLNEKPLKLWFTIVQSWDIMNRAYFKLVQAMPLSIFIWKLWKNELCTYVFFSKARYKSLWISVGKGISFFIHREAKQSIALIKTSSQSPKCFN